MDTRKRIFTKTLTFKILTTSVTYLITGSIASALIIHGAMTLCFIAHEFVWNRVKWGRKGNKTVQPENIQVNGIPAY